MKNTEKFSIIYITVIVVCMGIYFLYPKEKPVQMADTYEQLKLSVEFSGGEKEWIDIWKDEEEIYYFFLPAGTETGKINFGNLKDEDSIRINSRTIEKKDDIGNILTGLLSGQTVEMQMKIGGEEQEPVSLKFLCSRNIASVFIDTASGTVENIHADKNVKEKGEMCIVDAEGKNSHDMELEYIKTRGNSTWVLDKKPYKIKLKKDSALLGMPSAKEWVLLANAVDDTLIKNELIFRYAEKYTSVPSIRGQYVDLYMNGEYAGNYYLCEKVETGDSRLNITDLKAATERVNYEEVYGRSTPYVSEDGKIKATAGLVNPEDITGGYLVEYISDGEYEVTEHAFKTDSGKYYAVISPSQATVEQVEYICRLFDEMEVAMAQGDGINPATGKHFSEYMNIDSWASKYVMEEVFSNPDALIASMYFYKDCDSVDPLIYAGPMWDYDRALGSYGLKDYIIDDARKIGNYGIYVSELMKHEEVSSLVHKKFEEEMLPYVKYKVRNDIYELNQMLDTSAQMDDVRWRQSNGYYESRDAQTEYLSCFLEEKTDYLRDIWLGENQYCTVNFLDYYGNLYATYKVKYGERLPEVPVISSYEAIFAGWYVKGEDIPCISRLPVLSDVTYESRWIGMDILLQNGLGASEMEASQVDPKILENMAEILHEMQKEEETDNQKE